MSDKVSTLEEDEYGEDVDSEHFSSRGEVASQVFPMSERTLVRFLLHFASSQTLITFIRHTGEPRFVSAREFRLVKAFARRGRVVQIIAITKEVKSGQTFKSAFLE